ILMPPTVPINHYGGPRNQQNRTNPGQRFNYELFNCNNFNIRYWSWNYRGCWHQTCPPIVPR
ncbi:hypothetical protein P280DRAFT_414573, partial [Massarina eburnea CBS 473.64]